MTNCLIRNKIIIKALQFFERGGKISLGNQIVTIQLGHLATVSTKMLTELLQGVKQCF